MPLPAVAWAVFEFVVAAIAVYEAVDVMKDIYEGLDQYKKAIDKAKEELKDAIDKLKDEIDRKIDEKEEMAVLLAATGADPQNPVTRKAEGRGSGVAAIDAAIKQNIPFRQVVSLVCEKADALPVLNLRRKKGVTIKDLPKTKRIVLEKILERGIEAMTDADLQGLIVVRLKQLAANLMFEFIDHCIDWKSPLKCEVSFGPRPDFADHPVESGTKLVRLGDINPFYPAPHRKTGSIAADLVIPDYRKKRCDKGNIFAIVEVKFAGDRIDKEQFDNYARLLKRAAEVKTAAAPVRFDKKTVAYGGRLSLFRYPEDKAASSDQRDANHPKSKKSKGKA